jgi:hypothetical protein
VELARLSLDEFELEDDGVAELFGLELARWWWIGGWGHDLTGGETVRSQV